MGDSVLLDLLTARSERRETRIFAHATAETQESIAEAQCLHPPITSRPTTSQGALVSRPATSQGAGFLEVFPRVPSRPPRLLQELEALLVDRLRINDRLASTSMLLTKDRDPGMAANLSLDGHRQVFTAFIQSFAAYSSLLGRIQTALEQTLKDGMHCAIENIHLRERMGEEAHKRKVATARVRTQIMTSERAFKQAAFEKLQQARERVQRATKRAAAAEKERDKVRHQASVLEESVAALKNRQACLKALTAREVAVSQQPSSGHVLALKIRPLTHEDKRLLEQEHGSAVAHVLGEEPEPEMLKSLGAEGQPEESLLLPGASPFEMADGNELLPPGPALSPMTSPMTSPRKGGLESVHDSVSMTLSAGGVEQVQQRHQKHQQQQQQQQHEQGQGQQLEQQHAHHHHHHRHHHHHHQQQQQQQQHEQEHGHEEAQDGHIQGHGTKAEHQEQQGWDPERYAEQPGLLHSEQHGQQEQDLIEQQQEQQEHQKKDASSSQSETQGGEPNAVEHVGADQAQAAEAEKEGAAGGDVPSKDESKGKKGVGKKVAAGKKGKDKVSSSSRALGDEAQNPNLEGRANDSTAGDKARKGGASKVGKGKKGAAPPSKG
uniref:Uncharacterized protein n=1 Tax=Dunaliella tertiolecta TaxID=3047 RepID=A0A7S3QTX1_DUNTE|mmetsp:Transcript_13036/g.35502  ORF Transcript_13036/g.35502 Transcript_13036/m.35502 type:complete len:606 (+) Transcript_13036:129-1946(+)